MVKTDKSKLYTVTGVSVFGNDSNGPQTELIEFDQLYNTIDDAARAVADAVNEVLAEEGKQNRVNVKSCYEGYTLELDAGRWVYKIVAHDRPYIVTCMNCDDHTVEVSTHFTQEDAKTAVAKAAKQTLKEIDYAEHIYASRSGNYMEISKKAIQKSEPYINIESSDGNYIGISKRQI